MFLTFLIIDALILLVGPLLWAGGKWSIAALKVSLAIMVGVDLLLAIALSLPRRTRVRTRPPRT